MQETVKKSVEFLTVDSDRDGQRLDNFLLTYLKNLPRSRLYRLLRTGQVRVNKGRIKPNYRLKKGDIIRIPPVSLTVKDTPLVISPSLEKLLNDSILFEDGNLLVIDKPSGLAVHGGSGLSLGLIESIRQMRPECAHLELVHRLDRDTSGCLLIAKKRKVLLECHSALREKNTKKVYYAVVVGKWKKGIKSIKAPLKKRILKSGERLVTSTPDGKPSETSFELLKSNNNLSLIKAMPITGRTHQIRVHSKLAGCPILGDTKYGDFNFNSEMSRQGFKGLFLHAKSFNIKIQDKYFKFESHLPSSWDQILSIIEI